MRRELVARPGAALADLLACRDELAPRAPGERFHPCSGTGPTTAEANQRLEIAFPATSPGSVFGASYTSVCKLRGDFDVRVDYDLVSWLFGNGVRVPSRSSFLVCLADRHELARLVFPSLPSKSLG